MIQEEIRHSTASRVVVALIIGVTVGTISFWFGDGAYNIGSLAYQLCEDSSSWSCNGTLKDVFTRGSLVFGAIAFGATYFLLGEQQGDSTVEEVGIRASGLE